MVNILFGIKSFQSIALGFIDPSAALLILSNPKFGLKILTLMIPVF